MTFSDELSDGAEQRIWKSALGISPLPPSINNKQLYERLDSMFLSYLKEHEMLWQCFLIVEPLCTTEQRENLQRSFTDIQQNFQRVLSNRQAEIAITGDEHKAQLTLEELYQAGQKLSEVKQELEQFPTASNHI